MSQETMLKINGMDCAECAQKIEGSVSRIKGVVSAQVFLSTSSLAVNGKSDLNLAEVIKAIERLGYKVDAGPAFQNIILYVEGMDCPDEVEILEKKIKSLTGILNFNVNLTGQKVDLAYDPARLSIQNILKSIAATGMKARLAKSKTSSRSWWQDYRVKLIAVSGILLLIAFILDKAGLNANIVRVIYAASILAGGYFPAKMALAGLLSRTLNIYTLLVIATIGAIVLDYWDEAAMLVFVYTWGAILETFATEKARNSLKLLMELAPREALVKRNTQELTLPVGEVRLGDIIIIRPGEKVPLDGTIVTGSSSIDQAPITGESIPVGKTPGDAVFAASINQRGALEVKVTRLSHDTTLARIIQSVERSEAKKSSYQRFAIQFGRIYTPAMFGVAIIVAVVPWLLGQPLIPWVYRALVTLVVSCSCGLALSVPITVLATVSAAARKGVLIKGGADIEATGYIETVVFDKTGTLTIGLPRVTEIIKLNGSEHNLLSIAASIESRSEHPLAESILRKAREEGLEIRPLNEFEAMVGMGARGRVDGQDYYIGSKQLAEQMLFSLDGAEKEVSRLQSEGKTTILVFKDRQILGIIGVSDQLRPEAKETVTRLKRAGIKRVIMLTGDNEGTARAIAVQTGLDEYRAQLMPEDKVKAVKELKQKYGRVAMVGDGINDAPAMAAADVGIAMGAAGTDIALETADLALMSDDLSKISYAIRLSRKAVNVIRQNVAASLVIVALVVTMALIGKIGLVSGLLINEGSALIVMVNGLRLLRG